MNPPFLFAAVYCQGEASPSASRFLVNGYGVLRAPVHAPLPSRLDRWVKIEDSG